MLKVGPLVRRARYALGVDPSFWQLPNPLKLHEFRELVGLQTDLRGKIVLDVGCGRGVQTQLLARQGAYATGVDVQESVIARARTELAHSPVRDRVKFFRGTVQEARFPDEHFDAVYSFCVLEHIPDLPEVLLDLHRSMKPGGWLHATIDSLATIHDAAIVERHRTIYHVQQYFTEESIRLVLQQAGFTMTECRPILRSDNARDELTREVLGDPPMWERSERKEGLAKLDADESTAQREKGLMLLVRAQKGARADRPGKL